MVKWQKMALGCCFLAGVTILLSCTSRSPHNPLEKDGRNNGKRIVAISEQLVGTPYRYGGASPKGFDCSGLVRYVYGQIGITVPRSSRLLFQRSQKINLSNIQPGDLLFFNISKKKISHVGIYSAKGKFIHAPSSGKKVSIASLNNPYWQAKLVSAGRFH